MFVFLFERANDTYYNACSPKWIKTWRGSTCQLFMYIPLPKPRYSIGAAFTLIFLCFSLRSTFSCFFFCFHLAKCDIQFWFLNFVSKHVNQENYAHFNFIKRMKKKEYLYILIKWENFMGKNWFKHKKSPREIFHMNEHIFSPWGCCFLFVFWLSIQLKKRFDAKLNFSVFYYVNVTCLCRYQITH